MQVVIHRSESNCSSYCQQPGLQPGQILIQPAKQVQSNIMSTSVLSPKKTHSKATKRKSKELSNTKGATPKEPKKKKKKKKKKKRKALFVVKLFQFLMSDDQHVDIVSWYKDCFVVWDRNLFEANVLPLLFSHNKYASFERQVNFYNFAKMAIHDEFPTNKRIGKKDPIKYKHRMFYKGASLQQIQSIERSTSPHQIQELKNSLEGVNVKNFVIVENIKSLRERIASAQTVLNEYLSCLELPATKVNDTNNDTGNDEQADEAERAASEEIEFEMLEPNEKDIDMFFEVPVAGMESNTVSLSVLTPTFDHTTIDSI